MTRHAVSALTVNKYLNECKNFWGMSLEAAQKACWEKFRLVNCDEVVKRYYETDTVIRKGASK